MTEQEKDAKRFDFLIANTKIDADQLVKIGLAYAENIDKFRGMVDNLIAENSDN